MSCPSGTFLSALTVILCLGINIALYPEVRGMLEVGNARESETHLTEFDLEIPKTDAANAFSGEQEETQPSEVFDAETEYTEPPKLQTPEPQMLEPLEPLPCVIVEPSTSSAFPEQTTPFSMPPSLPDAATQTMIPETVDTPDDSFGLPSVFPLGSVKPLPPTNAEAEPAAFRPVVPTEMEEDYRNHLDSPQHQLKL